MPKNEQPEDGIDWSLTTWEGARREQLRRWAALPLERIIMALEEMQDLAEQFQRSGDMNESSAAETEQVVPPAKDTPQVRRNAGRYEASAARQQLV